jgi:hypothetical protein
MAAGSKEAPSQKAGLVGLGDTMVGVGRHHVAAALGGPPSKNISRSEPATSAIYRGVTAGRGREAGAEAPSYLRRRRSVIAAKINATAPLMMLTRTTTPITYRTIPISGMICPAYTPAH